MQDVEEGEHSASTDNLANCVYHINRGVILALRYHA